MTEIERREAEMRSIMKITGVEEPKKEAKQPKAEPKKPAKKESKKEDK